MDDGRTLELARACYQMAEAGRVEQALELSKRLTQHIEERHPYLRRVTVPPPRLPDLYDMRRVIDGSRPEVSQLQELKRLGTPPDTPTEP